VTATGSSRSSRKRRWWVRLLGNTGVALAAVLVSILICEVVLRVMHIGYPVYIWTDPVLGVAHIPGARSANTFNGQYWIEINEDGMRGPDTPLKAKPNTFRIALLGDSFIEAFEVPFEQTIGEVIRRRLSVARGTPVEVLNFGHGGYGTTQELLTLQHKVWKYSPNLVLLAMTTANDISDNYRPLKKTDYVPYHVFRGNQLVVDSSFLQSKGYRSRAIGTRRFAWLIQHSRLVQLINRVRHNQNKSERQQLNLDAAPGDEEGLNQEVGLPPASPEWKEAWRVTEAILDSMRNECRKNQTPLAIVTLTRGIQVSPVREDKEKFLRALGAKDLYYPERRIAEFGKREGIPVLNLAPPMAEQAESRKVYFHAHGDSLGIGHWNKEGHEAAGTLVASWLEREFPLKTASKSPAAP
jgi:hypothetical protein